MFQKNFETIFEIPYSKLKNAHFYSKRKNSTFLLSMSNVGAYFEGMFI